MFNMDLRETLNIWFNFYVCRNPLTDKEKHKPTTEIEHL